MIGILGGTFDPIHYGHLRAAIEVKDLFGLNEVRLLPCAQPPHRPQPQTTSLMRVAMLQLAINNHSGLSIDTRELDRDGPSYMLDTLISLRHEFATEPLLLFIGGDAFNHLTSWYKWQKLFNYAHIVVMTRPHFSNRISDDFLLECYTKDKTELAQYCAGKLYFQAITQLEISASTIRNMIAQQQNPGFLLPDSVIAYIGQNKLYQRH